MLSREEMIAKILSLRPNLTREALQEMIRRKREGTGRFLTEEGAAYMVANELGIDLSGERTLRTRISVKDLVVGANDVTLTGRVLAVYPVKTFTRSSGVEGKVARFVLADEDGTSNVVLWDENAEMVEQGRLSPNQVVRVNHGYVRAGLDGRPEINVGRRGSVVVLPPHLVSEQSFTRELTFKKIRDLGEGYSYVNLLGVVRIASPVSTFRRADGREGRVSSVRLADDTDRIRVVFWDEKADLMETLKRGDCLKIVNGQLRRGLGGRLEIHVGRASRVTVLPEAPRELALPKLVLTKIGTLEPGLDDVDILGSVMGVGQVREFTRPSGDAGRVGDLYLADKTGSVRLSLWDEKADLLEKVSLGDAVLVEGAYTRQDRAGVGLSLGRLGSLTVNPDAEEVGDLPPVSSYTVPIGQLEVGREAFVEGVLTEEPYIRTVTTRDAREARVASFRIRDETGEIRVSLWNELADEVENLPLGTVLRIRNAYVRAGFDGTPELSSRSATEVEILSKAEGHDAGANVVPATASQRRRISELRKGETVSVQGTIVDLSNSRVYPACPNCRRRAREEEGRWVCRRCGAILQPTYRLLVNALLRDDSGQVVAVFGGSLAERLLGMRAEYAWNVATQSGDEKAPVKMVSGKLVGRTVRLSGRVAVDRFDGSLRIMVNALE